MKASVLTFLFFCAVALTSGAQTFRGLDKSPLDIAYFPDHFAHDRKEGEKALVKVVYSRPYRNNREIFGGVVPLGKVWRTGANENTEITFYEDADFAGQKIKKGTYSLFTIPDKDSWTIILNSSLDYWGAYSYNEKNDVTRVRVQTGKTEKPIENFSIQFESRGSNSAEMLMAWENILVRVPISFHF